MPSREHVQALIDGVRAGSIGEIVARFYAPGVLPVVAEGLRRPQVVHLHDAKVGALAVDGDRAVIEWGFEFQRPKGRRRFRQQQVWVQTWKDDKVVAESRYASGRGGPLLLTADGLVLNALRPAVARIGLVLASFAVAFVVTEVVVRQFPRVQIIVQPLDKDRQPLDFAKVQRPLDSSITPPGRPGQTLAPGLYHLRYPGLQRPWLEKDGTVAVRINQAGIRDREEIGFDKPPGQRRILCLGDSLTFGWGIPVEDCWPRKIEPALRQRFGDVRTVNCGFMGTLVVDEYWFGLKHRFYRFQPDMVVVTLCLNDLVICNGQVAHFRTAPATGSVLLNRIMGWLGGERHRLDPDVDHAGRLMNLRADDPMYTRYGVTRDMLWASGNPQNALREMHAWCDERSLPMVVILWPFLQGLETDQTYPFQKLHDLAREFCASEKIPFLDLLPALKGHRSTDLWVAPYDQHGNPKAQELVSSPIARFLIQHCNFEDR